MNKNTIGRVADICEIEYRALKEGSYAALLDGTLRDHYRNGASLTQTCIGMAVEVTLPWLIIR